MARFLGTSSPKSIVSTVLERQRRGRRRPGARAPSGTPAASSGPSISSRDRRLGEEADGQVGDGDADLGAGELGRERAQRLLDARGAGVTGRRGLCSTWLRSTVTKANSAATNTPQASDQQQGRRRAGDHSVIGRPPARGGASADVESGDFESRPWLSVGSFASVAGALRTVPAATQSGDFRSRTGWLCDDTLLRPDRAPSVPAPRQPPGRGARENTMTVAPPTGPVPARRSVLGAAGAGSCRRRGTGSPRRRRAPLPARPLPRRSPAQPAADCLVGRFSYGVTPALARQVRAAGGARAWFEWQLAPGGIPDPRPTSCSTGGRAWPSRAPRPGTGRSREIEGGWEAAWPTTSAGCCCAGSVTRRQVLEVMTEFWENHFNVPANGDAAVRLPQATTATRSAPRARPLRRPAARRDHRTRRC